MNNIQLNANTTIEMNNKFEKYLSFIRNKGYSVLALVTVFIFVLFIAFSLNNNSGNQNNNTNLSALVTDSVNNKIVVEKKSEIDPIFAYGNLLKNLESKKDSCKILNLSIASCDKKIKELTLKISSIVSNKDSLILPDSIKTSLLLKSIVQIENIEIEKDSIAEKQKEYSKNKKRIEGDSLKLSQQIILSKITLQKHITDNIDKSLIEGQGILDFKDVRYYFCIVDPKDKTKEINFHLKNNDKKNYSSISSLLKDKLLDSLDFLMITNGGMYTPQHEPQGLFIEKGIVIKPLDESIPNNNTNFYLMPNGVFYIDSNGIPGVKTTSEYAKINKSIHPKYATQSGPMLVIDGILHDKFVESSKNLNIRSGVGITNSNKVVFLISEGYVNFWDFATVFKDVLSCKNALYLDGAISLMYLKDRNKDVQGGNFGPMISVSKLKK